MRYDPPFLQYSIELEQKQPNLALSLSYNLFSEVGLERQMVKKVGTTHFHERFGFSN